MTSGDTEEIGIIVEQDIKCNDWIIPFRWSVHLGEDILGKGFGNSIPRESE